MTHQIPRIVNKEEEEPEMSDNNKRWSVEKTVTPLFFA
jgi:hypothetical protein